MAKPMHGKWKTQIEELQIAGIKTGNICTPQRLYRALLKMKGIEVPKRAKITPAMSLQFLNDYRRTGVLATPMNFEINPASRVLSDVCTRAFLETYEWRSVRYQALKQSKGLCSLCGRGAKHGVVLHVDHIKPRRKFPELALTLANLQVLCADCNHGKGNWDETDWR